MGMVALEPLEGPGAAAGPSCAAAKAKVAARRKAQKIFFISISSSNLVVDDAFGRCRG
ncbi:flagellar biosynthesis protein FlhF [Sesbania bispinosa]|nr:flagellar biosynthesis protein FlhF [Sesbania bispinosa]